MASADLLNRGYLIMKNQFDAFKHEFGYKLHAFSCNLILIRDGVKCYFLIEKHLKLIGFAFL